MLKNAKKIIRSIGLALHASHNTVTTDLVDFEPNETSWRIDNSKEIAMIDKLEEQVNTGICPLCGHCNSTL